MNFHLLLYLFGEAKLGGEQRAQEVDVKANCLCNSIHNWCARKCKWMERIDRWQSTNRFPIESRTTHADPGARGWTPYIIIELSLISSKIHQFVLNYPMPCEWNWGLFDCIYAFIRFVYYFILNGHLPFFAHSFDFVSQTSFTYFY